MYHRKAFGPQRRSSRQALARDIAASILAAQQRGEHWPITFYTQQAETIRLVEEQLAAAARDSQPAQVGALAITSWHRCAPSGGVAAACSTPGHHPDAGSPGRAWPDAV